MTRGKQKIEAQRRNAERNQKPKGSQIEARAVGLKVICPICKVLSLPLPSFYRSFYMHITCVRGCPLSCCQLNSCGCWCIETCDLLYYWIPYVWSRRVIIHVLWWLFLSLRCWFVPRFFSSLLMILSCNLCDCPFLAIDLLLKIGAVVVPGIGWFYMKLQEGETKGKKGQKLRFAAWWGIAT